MTAATMERNQTEVKKELSYINPFLISAIEIIKKMTNVKVSKKKVSVKRGKKSIGGVGIVLDLNGDVAGKVVYEFSREMTMRLSSMMIKESRIFTSTKEEYKKLLESAILELGNVVTGNALGYLQKNGFNCDITPPKFYLGKGVDLIPFYLTTYVLDFTTEYGDFTINVSLSNKKYY